MKGKNNAGIRLLDKIESVLGEGILDEVRHSKAELCTTSGCPMTFNYTEILVTRPHGWLLVIDNVMMWVDRDEVELDQNEQTLVATLCYAATIGLIKP